LIPTPSLLLSRRGRGKYQSAQLQQCPLLDQLNLLELVLDQGLLNLLDLDQDPFLLALEKNPFQLGQEQGLWNLLALDQDHLQWAKECHVLVDVTVQMELNNVTVTATAQ